MEIFLDTASRTEIARWLSYGVGDGVTTNPTIMVKDGVQDIEREVKEIAAMVDGRPVSVEVTTNDLDEMLAQGREFAGWATNIVVKIPVVNASGAPCLGVIKALRDERIKVNATALMSFGQVVLAAKANATYASIFAGRVSDEGHDAPALIRAAVDWLQRWNYDTKIIVGSIRGVIDIQEAALSGAHVITIPTQFLDKMVDHKNTRATVREFVEDARKVLARKPHTGVKA